jgi:hypothetical protein
VEDEIEKQGAMQMKSDNETHLSAGVFSTLWLKKPVDIRLL